MLKIVSTLFLSSIPVAICIAQPSITSFSPTSGPIGTTVTITGNNFAGTPAANTVYFGSVKANVLMASPSSLSVTVPPGAAYQPITVTTANLTAYSPKPFVATFHKDTLTLDQSMFSSQTDIPAGGAANDIATGDFNNDGKPDLVTANYDSGSISVFRNTSASSITSFASKVDYKCGLGTSKIAIADIDGDGKLDIAVTTISPASVSIFRNTTTGSTISFAAKVDLSAESFPIGIAVQDLNDDGKPDIAVACLDARTLCVYQNKSTPGNILFENSKKLIAEYQPLSVAIGDLDSDGKPDIAVSNFRGNSVSVYRNISVDSISLEAKVDFASGVFPASISISDIDNDGVPDLAVANDKSYDATISLLKNKSTTGLILFMPPVSFATGSDPTSMKLFDFTGDGLVDIVTSNGSSGSISFLKNQSVNGTFGFSAKNDLFCSGAPYGLAVIDLNLDGNADIALANYTSKTTSLFNNEIDKIHVYSSFPSSGSNQTNVTISGRNFINITGVQFGGIPAQSYNVVSATTIHAVPAAGSSGAIKVNSINGTSTGSFFQYVNPPSITSFTPDSGNNGNMIVINGSNLYGATNVTIGGVPVSSFSSFSFSSITAYVGSGASGNIEVTTAGGTAVKSGFKFLGPEITSFSPVNAGMGDTVTIIGKKFKNVTSVSLGGTPVPFIVLDSVTIRAVADTGSSGIIKLITQNGQVQKDGYSFVGPSISSIEPLVSGTGKTITINGKNFTGTTEVRFGGVQASSFTVLSPNQIKAVVADGNSGDVSVKSIHGIAIKSGFVFVGTPQIFSFTPQSAGPGTEITITGSNLLGIDSVLIGGAKALRFTNSSADSIKAIVPETVSGVIKVVGVGGSGQAPGFSFLHPPVITSFTPQSATVGSSVIISGNFFNSNAQSNTVYFGAVKATITSASPTQLTVTVPSGATYEPITVQCNTLTAYSKTPFKILSTDSFNVFVNTSFEKNVVPSVGTYLNSINAKDLNDDGKPEIVVSNTNQFNLFLNNSDVKKINFENQVTNQFSYGQGAKFADFDGDGKNDIAVLKPGMLSVSRKTGSGNSIILESANNFTADDGALYMDLGDIDKDGKIDVIAGNVLTESTVSIFRNNGYPGYISFDDRIDLVTVKSPQRVQVIDIDGDGLQDLVFINNQSNTISVIQNISTPGNIVLVPKGDYAINDDATSVALGDFDNDNRPDAVVSYVNAVGTPSISIFKNLSLTGKPSFAPKVDLPATLKSFEVNVGDLDGDGKVDIITAGGGYVSLYKNSFTSGNSFNFLNRVDINVPLYGSTYRTAIADFDGDNKQDIGYCYSSNYDDGIYIYRNQLGEPNAVSLCRNESTSFASNRQGNSYQWQVDTGNGFVNLSNGTNYSGVNSETLQLIAMPSSAYSYKYRCVVDGINGYVFTLKFYTKWYGFFGNSWEEPRNWSCQFVPDANTDVLIEGGVISINSDVTVKSLTIKPDATVIVEAGHKVVIAQ